MSAMNKAPGAKVVDGGQVTVAGALTTLIDIPVAGCSRLGMEIDNDEVGGAALTAFQIQAKFHPNGAYSTLFTSYASPSGILVGALTTLATLADNAHGWFILDTLGLYMVRLRANCATSTVVIPRGRIA